MSRLLALPLELREQIYKHCIPQNAVFDLENSLYDEEFPAGWVTPTKSWIETYRWPMMFSQNSCIHYDTRREASKMYEEHGPFYRRCSLETDFEYYHVCKRCRMRLDPRYASGVRGLVSSCRQVCEEVESLLYGRNEFHVSFNVDKHNGAEAAHFAPRVLQKMRHIILTVDLDTFDDYLEIGDVSWDTPEGPVPITKDFWRDVGRDLTTLKVIVKWIIIDRKKRVLEVQDYLDVLGSTLIHLANVLPAQTTITIDTGGHKLLPEVFEKYLPQRCHFQPLRFGDLTFNRAEFASARALKSVEEKEAWERAFKDEIHNERWATAQEIEADKRGDPTTLSTHW